MLKIVPSGTSLNMSSNNIDSALGLASNSVIGVVSSGPSLTTTNYGAVKNNFSLNSGTTYSFAWAYSAGDYLPFSDGVFFSIGGNGVSSFNLLARNGASSIITPAIGYPTGTTILQSYGSTAWATYSFTVPTSATYTLAFGSFNALDTGLDPVLFVSGIAGTFTGTPVATSGGTPTVTPNIDTGAAYYTTVQLASSEVLPAFEGGTLKASSATTISSAFTINNNGGTVDTNSFNLVLSGVISGTGGLTKTGAGTLTLTGVNTYSGTTTISAGTLLVGSSSSNTAATVAGSTLVASGATLGGYGVVGASGTTLTNSGNVSPANSIGTLRVGGAFVQNSSGNLAIEITPSTADLLAVSETASLAGTLTVTGESGTYLPTRYTLLTSSGRTGTFDTLSTNLSTYTTLGYFLSYDDNNAYLTLGPDYVNTTTALTRNLEQLKSVFASQAGLQVSGLNYDCSTFGENNVCLSTGGRTSHVFNKSDAYDGSHPMTTSALLIGAYRLDPTVRVGAWIDQNLNTQNSNIRMSNAKPMLGIFGVYYPSGDNTQWQVKASASYVEKDLDITRQQLTNTEPGHGKTSFKGLAAQLDVAYGFAGLVPNAVVSPVVGIRYYSGRANDYTEETSSSVQVPISYNKFREIAGVAFAGLKLDGSIVPEFRYNLSAGVETDVKRNNPTYSGTSSIYELSTFNIQGNSSPRDTRGYANVGISYLIDKTQSINFGVYYRQDQFKKVESVSSVLTYTVGL
jgi:autotransporter-associated beta strand protein